MAANLEQPRRDSPGRSGQPAALSVAIDSPQVMLRQFVWPSRGASEAQRERSRYLSLDAIIFG